MTPVQQPTASQVQPPAARIETAIHAAPSDTKESQRSEKCGASFWRKIGLVWVIGVVCGGAIEFVVGGMLDSTGWFGPTLDTIIEQQSANFTDIRSKLDALNKATPGSPEAAKLQSELAGLMAEQEKLASRTHVEIKTFQEEIARLREQALQSRGSATGADFWLAPKETITVGDREFVFAVVSVRYGGSYIDINLSGKTQALKPGDFVEFKTTDRVCRVFYKAAKPREDGRYGFDLVCTPLK